MEMYCPKCGTENPGGVQLCQSCSWLLAGVSTSAQNPDAKTSGLAITSLVLMILSFFTFCLTALPAIIFGIVALVKIEKSGGQLKGKGFAIAGLAAPIILVPLAMGILIPALAKTRMLAHRMVCGTNMSSLGRAMIIYTNDYDNVPTVSKWCDLLIENSEVIEKQFLCKGASQGPCNYAMNKNIEKHGIYAPLDMVLLFESGPGWNQSGGRELLTTENHRGEGCNILFYDGHVQFVKSEDINDLNWNAE